MNISHDTIEASYAYCRQMSRRAGSSFHAGFLLLPREKRRAMEALYAFMRHTDDLADDDCLKEGTASSGQWSVASGQHESVISNPQSPIPNPAESLAAWRASLNQALNGIFPSPPSALRPSSSLLPALADTVRQFHIPPKHLLAVIDGVEMDLVPRRFETFDELERYCEHVASAVGLACIHIWGFRGPEALEPARQVGVALQLTNILRDLKEDAAAGRVYLPLADLRECGYSEEELLAGVANDAFLRLMRFEIDRAKQFYRNGIQLWDQLEPDGRRIFGLMTATYWELLKRIEHRPADVLKQRVRLSRLSKLRLFARWMLCSQSPLVIEK